MLPPFGVFGRDQPLSLEYIWRERERARALVDAWGTPAVEATDTTIHGKWQLGIPASVSRIFLKEAELKLQRRNWRREKDFL